MAARVVGLVLAGLAGACSPKGAAPANSATAPPAAPGYLTPPELTSAVASAGGVALSGTASPGVGIRLATPTGAALFTGADADGHWALTIPASAQPRLFSLSMTQDDRVMQAMGYLFVAPDGRAVRLRSGGGSEALAMTGGGLAAGTLDYDTQRAATLSGVAPAGQTVSLRVDGVERGQAAADAAGRFSLPLSAPLEAGERAFDLTGGSAELTFQAAIGPTPQASGGGPFLFTPSGGGWRVDWLTPGGGEQTTLLLGRPSS